MLQANDLALLKEILRRGAELEQSWPASGQLDQKSLEKLQELMRKAENSASPDIQRLAKWAEHLTETMNLRHFIGIMVPFERLAQKSLRDDEFLPVVENDLRSPRANAEKLPLIPILENIRSAFNVGAVFRTAECWGLEKIVLTGYTPDPSEEKTAKTSMGTSSLVEWSRATRTEDVCHDLKKQGYTVVALETVESAPELTKFSFPEKTALLLGNERFGLDPDSLKLADQICRIPVRGQKNSLNVGIAFGIAAYEYFRQKAR